MKIKTKSKSNKKKINTSVTIKKTKKVVKCKKEYLFINIYGTINFLISKYLLKKATDPNNNETIKVKIKLSILRYNLK